MKRALHGSHVVCSLIGLLLAAGVEAQQPPPRDTVVRSDPIRVRATRPVITVGGASAVAVAIDSLDTAAAATLEQVLREMPLVQVRMNSRGEAQFSLRGSGADARQVAVLFDGVPLNLGWDDRADLSVLPATAATSLTLVRGLPSVLYGPNVLGGVVEVDVAQGSAAGVARASAEARADITNAGAYSLAGAAAAPVSLERGIIAVRAGAGYRERAGLPLARGVVQPAPYDDPDLRANTDLRHADAFLAARFDDTRGTWLSFASSAFRAERGIAAELHAEQPRFWRYPDLWRTVTAVTAGTGDRAAPLGGRGDMEASVGIDAAHTEIVSYADASYRDVDGTEDADDRTVTLRLLADQTLGASADLRTAFTYVDITHDELLSGTVANAYRQRLWSAGAETIWRLPTPLASHPLLRVSVGGTLDGADTPRSGDKPSIGSLHDWGARIGMTAVAADGASIIHAAVSRRARFPALRELYSGALGRFEPNPALRPELLTAVEAGITAQTGGAELQLVGFLRNLGDAIEQVTLPDRRRQRVNAGEVRSGGLEALASLHWRALTVSADATVQRVDLRGAGALRPEYQPALMAGLAAGLSLPAAIGAGVDVRYTGSQYCLNPNGPGQLELSSSARADLHAGRTTNLRRRGFGSAVELRASIDNVTNAAIYDQCGLPQPGRLLRLQVRLR